MKKPRPLGKGSMANDHGYDLGLLVSWLEVIRDHEEETAKGGRMRDVEKLSDAVNTLSELCSKYGE